MNNCCRFQFVLAFTFLGTAPVWAADEAPAADAAPPVALVRVHLPITGNADQALVNTISRISTQLVAEAKAARLERRPILVLEFTPHSATSAGEGSQFERVLALARYLSSRDIAGVKTVAYLPGSIHGHGTLLALACEEIVMAPQATLGDADLDEQTEGTIRQTVTAAYREIAESRRTIPTALALSMIDPEEEVLQVETEQGVSFVSRSEFAEFAQQHEIVGEKTLVPRGTTGLFDGREGREFGFVKYLAGTTDELARALDVPPELLVVNESFADQWRPVIVDVRGKITRRVANQVESLLGTAIDQHGANWVALRIDSAGGDLEASVRIATTLARLDKNSVRTVAYVPGEALGGAALVALACDQLVMHPRAALGNGATEGPVDEPQRAAFESVLRESLAPWTEQSWSLLASLVDGRIELFHYHNRVTGAERMMSEAEVGELADAADWQQREPLMPAGEPLRLDGAKAHDLGLAFAVIDDYDAMQGLYNLPEPPQLLEPNWALEFIEALATPEFSIILLMVGFAGIYFELRTPGVGLGAFIGATALLLFFWSKYLDGTAGWLEVLLFAAGICFLLLEIFVLPGFGIFGLGGGALVFASIVLASLTFVSPHSESQLEELTQSVGMVAIALAGVLVFAMVSRRYLHQAPVFRGVLLTPPQGAERQDLESHEALADYSDLVGKRGVAATNLRPSGKIEIDHRLVDVLAESEPIDRGTQVLVVDAHANRVIVRAVGPA